MAAKSNKLLVVEIAKKIAVANDKLKKAKAEVGKKNKITGSQFEALSVIKTFGASPLKKINEEMMVTGANTTVVMDNLEKESLVQRIFSKEDRRVILAELTKKGDNTITKLLPLYADAVTKENNNLNFTEQKQLLGLLDKLLN